MLAYLTFIINLRSWNNYSCFETRKLNTIQELCLFGFLQNLPLNTMLPPRMTQTLLSVMEADETGTHSSIIHPLFLILTFALSVCVFLIPLKHPECLLYVYDL